MMSSGTRSAGPSGTRKSSVNGMTVTTSPGGDASGVRFFLGKKRIDIDVFALASGNNADTCG